MAMHSKQIAFIAMMGALGNVLAFITIAPTLVKQIALDFSSVPVLVAATFGGAGIGALTGLIAGFLPSIFFGFIGGQLGILGFSTSIGKALQGFTLGLLVKAAKNFEKKTLLLIPLVLISFIPEMVWIIIVFSIFVPLFIPSQSLLAQLLTPILAKAWFEMAVMSIFMSALAGHSGFKNFISPYIATSTIPISATQKESG